MWKIALAISLTASCAYSQGTRRFVPPETRRVTGAVVDQAGEAIANARVFDNDRYPAYETGPDGRFDFDTKAPAIIVRKPGFESVIVRTQDASEIPVTLQKLTRTFPIC